MTNSRRQKLEAMLADQPGDQFLRYGLAMELNRDGEHERSIALFRELMLEQPPHVPAYFMAGQQLAKLNRIEEAREILRNGIEVARQAGSSHAAGEMSEFLAGLGSEK